MAENVERSVLEFAAMYRTKPPWDIDRPQPDIVRLEEAGRIIGRVLDVGCGTGENALYLAARGHEVWAVDFVESAITQAREKALRRGLTVTWRVFDALRAAELGTTFDTIIDSGLFHVFPGGARAKFVDALRAVLRPGGFYVLLCFSDRELREGGPRRITEQEIRGSFNCGWMIEALRETRFDATLHEGGSRAWLALIRRT